MKSLLTYLVLSVSMPCWAWAPENIELYRNTEQENGDTNETSIEESMFDDEENYEFAHASACSVVQGVASWYGPGFDGNRTANGERFDQDELTAAHRSLKFNSIVRVTYRGRSVDVRINDRGPYARGRVIDLSKAAAEEIGLVAAGHARVTIEVISCGSAQA